MGSPRLPSGPPKRKTQPRDITQAQLREKVSGRAADPPRVVIMGEEDLKRLIREQVAAALADRLLKDSEMAARLSLHVKTWRVWVASCPELRGCGVKVRSSGSKAGYWRWSELKVKQFLGLI